MFFFFLLSLIELLWFIFYSRSDFGFIPVCVHTHRAIASAAAAAVAASFKEIKERGTHRTYVRRSWQRKNSLYFINMQSVVSVWFSHFFSYFLLLLLLHRRFLLYSLFALLSTEYLFLRLLNRDFFFVAHSMQNKWQRKQAIMPNDLWPI